MFQVNNSFLQIFPYFAPGKQRYSFKIQTNNKKNRKGKNNINKKNKKKGKNSLKNSLEELLIPENECS